MKYTQGINTVRALSHLPAKTFLVFWSWNALDVLRRSSRYIFRKYVNFLEEKSKRQLFSSVNILNQMLFLTSFISHLKKTPKHEENRNKKRIMTFNTVTKTMVSEQVDLQWLLRTFVTRYQFGLRQENHIVRFEETLWFGFKSVTSVSSIHRPPFPFHCDVPSAS